MRLSLKQFPYRRPRTPERLLMDSPDQRGAVSRLVLILRKITRVMQVLPFAYLFVLALYLLSEFALPGWAGRIADNVLNLPCLVFVGMIAAGRLLKLCAWHRAACLLPLGVKLESYVDAFIVSLTQIEVISLNTFFGVFYLSFLFLAYRHFFK